MVRWGCEEGTKVTSGASVGLRRISIAQSGFHKRCKVVMDRMGNAGRRGLPIG